MEITNKLKERFCKDCKIPINVFDEPYFEERLQLYNDMYDAWHKWWTFEESLKKYDSEQDYFEEYNRIKDLAINDIKESEGYQRFNSEDMNKYAIKHTNMPGKDIFKPSFDGEYFVSIDIVKANFSCLSHYDSTIFFETSTWEDFIARYTDNPHIVKSKYIRQVILGSCNPKRHITYEKFLMDKVLDTVEEKLGGLSDVVFFSNDEIVIHVDNNDFSREAAGNLALDFKTMLANWEVPLRIEAFKLHKIEGTNGYCKKFLDGSLELKCLDGFMIPFVLRKLYGQKVTEGDRVFFYEGLKSKVVDLPEITI